MVFFFFFKQKTAYEMRISDWSSDVCSSDLRGRNRVAPFVFTGIQILSPRLLVDAPEGPFSTNLFWDRAIAAERAYGLVHPGVWFDIGAPEALQATENVIGPGCTRPPHAVHAPCPPGANGRAPVRG